MAILSDPTWSFIKDITKDNFWKPLSFALTAIVIIVGFFLKIPQFIKLFYYIRQHSRGKVEVIGNIVQILKRLGVTTQIAQSFQDGRYAIDYKQYSFEASRNLYFHISDIHKQNPFCSKCYPALNPMAIFDIKNDRWKCSKCNNFSREQGVLF